MTLGQGEIAESDLNFLLISSLFSLHKTSLRSSQISFDSAPKMAEIHDQFDTILILDFGSQVEHGFTSTESLKPTHYPVQPSHHKKMS